ncbi:RNA-binding cell elongation regulator Jag/EloR [Ligilactobacillus sp. LYQ60]|uniref:RNA-binding cell elongation regulator Jag/EloR n=1 Tax=unclassified Ligilactobacillus TaxID=2767920 RepID=UPI003851E1C4
MEFTGETVDEAVAAGLAQLKCTRDEVTVTVVTAGKRGFLGIGRQDAVVTMEVREQPQAPTQEAQEPVAEKQQAADEAQLQEESVASKQSRQTSQEAARDAVVTDLGNYLATVTAQMGVPATVNVTVGHRQVTYRFVADEADEGKLIGKHGKVLNALQLLAQNYVDARYRHHLRIILDVADYRERRRATLEHLAERTAADVIASGRPVYLNPMPAGERKVIHQALAKNDYVTTISRGRDPRRGVVVRPAHRDDVDLM